MANVEYENNNIVLTVSYRDVEFDLERISSGLEGARYDPEVFPGSLTEHQSPKLPSSYSPRGRRTV